MSPIVPMGPRDCPYGSDVACALGTVPIGSRDWPAIVP
jgi:hypothetical protein